MRKRGFTIVESIIGVILFTIVSLAGLALMIQGTTEFQMTSSETNLNNENAQGIRYVTQKLRNAMSVSITNGGAQITYVVPKMSDTVNAVTGEKELVYPLTSDGLTHTMTVNYVTGKLTDNFTGQTIVRDVQKLDPEKSSSQYGLVYQPFQLGTIGSKKSVTITLITLDTIGAKTRYVRLKSSVLLRNLR